MSIIIYWSCTSSLEVSETQHRESTENINYGKHPCRPMWQCTHNSAFIEAYKYIANVIIMLIFNSAGQYFTSFISDFSKFSRLLVTAIDATRTFPLAPVVHMTSSNLSRGHLSSWYSLICPFWGSLYVMLHVEQCSLIGLASTNFMYRLHRPHLQERI